MAGYERVVKFYAIKSIELHRNRSSLSNNQSGIEKVNWAIDFDWKGQMDIR